MPARGPTSGLPCVGDMEGRLKTGEARFVVMGAAVFELEVDGRANARKEGWDAAD